MYNYFNFINEEIRLQQVQNMIGQILSAEKKEQIDIVPGRKSALMNGLVSLINKLNIAGTGEEKTALIWLLTEINIHRIPYSYINADSPGYYGVIIALELYFKFQAELKPLSTYTFPELNAAIKEAQSSIGLQEALGNPVAEGMGYSFYKIEDVRSAMRIGDGSGWCINKQFRAEEYLQGGPLYVVFKGKKRYALFSFEKFELHDAQNHPLDAVELKELAIASNDYFKDYCQQLYPSFPRAILIPFLGYLSDDEQIAVVNKNQMGVLWLLNPSEKAQIAAVSESRSVFEYIKNPSEKVMFAAIQRDPATIAHIENPSEELQMSAIIKDTTAIYYINNKSPKAVSLYEKLSGHKYQ